MKKKETDQKILTEALIDFYLNIKIRKQDEVIIIISLYSNMIFKFNN